MAVQKEDHTHRGEKAKSDQIKLDLKPLVHRVAEGKGQQCNYLVQRYGEDIRG